MVQVELTDRLLVDEESLLALTGISKASLKKHRLRGKLKYSVVAKKIWFRGDWILAWLTAREQQSLQRSSRSASNGKALTGH